MATRITTLSSGGKALPFRSPVIRGDGTPSVTVQPQGTMVRERLNLRAGLTGSAVRVTNPSFAKRNQRTASLGMGAVGQRGRVMDIAGL
jgi:hypothetical protein